MQSLHVVAGTVANIRKYTVAFWIKAYIQINEFFFGNTKIDNSGTNNEVNRVNST